MAQNESLPRFSSTTQYPMIIPEAPPPMLSAEDQESLWRTLLAEGVIPVCAACEEPAQERDFCTGCNLFIHDACDPHVTTEGGD